ncbi:peptide deformylase [Candidatus Fermentibacteria bacterium]|nr:MAG: peptide deformylase [Candidatus Fermentibacteria bacterium]
MTSRMSSVRIIGDPVLRKKSIPLVFPENVHYINTLVKAMQNTLEVAEGLGLAAPQVGESVRLFIAVPNYLEELKGHVVFINPEIQPYGEMEKREEGCLSIPGIYEVLSRHSQVKITASDTLGNKFTLDVSGLAARLVLHEVDHLDGILFVDRLSPIKKKLLRGKIKRLKEDRSVY